MAAKEGRGKDGKRTDSTIDEGDGSGGDERGREEVARVDGRGVKEGG